MEFRTVCAKCGGLKSAQKKSYPPPDPYKAGLDRMRRDDPTLTKAPATPKPTSATPPDPYAAGLDKLRKENNR